MPVTSSGGAENPVGKDGVVHGMVGLRYDDANTREFLKAVLKSMDVQYFVRTEPGGATVYWRSSSHEQEQEIQSRVSQYTFVTEVCHGLPAPAPDEPAKKQLSCEQ